MKTLRLGVVGALAVAAVACGKGPDDASSTLHVTGTVDGRTLDNASALAIGSNGKTYAAYIQRSGRFALDLPAGHVYRIAIANSTMSGELRMVGHVVNRTSQGVADVLAVHEGGSLDLGKVSATGTSGTLHTSCECGTSSSSSSGGSSGDGDTGGGDKAGSGGDGDKSDGAGSSDDGGDDYKCHEHDDDKDKTCDDGVDAPLTPEHNPGDKCAKSGDDEDAPDTSSAKACKSSDKDHDGKDDDDSGDKGDDGSGGDKSGSGSSSGYGSSSGGYGDDGGSSSGGSSSGDGTSSGGAGGSGSGSACTCSKQCGAGSTCVASKCQPSGSY